MKYRKQFQNEGNPAIAGNKKGAQIGAVVEGQKLNRAQRRKLYHLRNTKKGRQLLRNQQRLQKMWEKVIPSSPDGDNSADFRAPEKSEIATDDGEVVNKETL